MAQPTEPIHIIATDTLGGDGYTNKEQPDGTIITEGFTKQSLAYQAFNYLHYNQASWLEYLFTEYIPDADVVLQDQIDVINVTTIPAEATARSDADGVLQGNIDTINNTTIPAHTGSANPHSDSQATSDWVVTSGNIADGATIPIPAGFALGDCEILASPDDTGSVAWDVNENGTYLHFRVVCTVSAGVLSCYRTTEEGVGTVTTPLTANYILIGRKGSF